MVYSWVYILCVCVPSGKWMNVGSNPAVGAGFFLARKTGVCYGYGAGVALGSQNRAFMPSTFSYNTLHFMPSICM